MLAEYGETPLHLAAARGAKALSKLLMDAGADASAETYQVYFAESFDKVVLQKSISVLY